ncbi:GDYXXLXY domain-containing protein [Oceanobacillus sp. CAU 1775]
MKRITLYSLLIVQAIVLLLLGSQHYLTDSYGQEVKLEVRPQDYAKYNEYPGSLYIDYKINTLSSDVWEIDEEMNYGERVYVVLTPDEDGIYEAVKATKEKPQISENQVILNGHFQYMDSNRKTYHVNYDIEEVNNKFKGEELRSKKPLVVTVKIAPWGHKSVVQIGND